MSSYTVVSGDDYEAVARKSYGIGTLSGRISAANPGTSEPLTAGTVLYIPPYEGAPTGSSANTTADSADEVALTVDGTRFRYWSGMTITRVYDGIDQITLTAPFDPDDLDALAAFVPFSFLAVAVTVGGAALFTGTLLDVTPTVTASGRVLNVTAYATPGVLADCTLPASAEHEWSGLGLSDIADAVTQPFGVSVVFDEDEGSTIERAACGNQDRALTFLSGLAAQRGLVLGSTEDGELEFRAGPDTGSPVAVLTEGAAPLLSVTPAGNARSYYSHLTGVTPGVTGLAGTQYTHTNAFLPGIMRPFTFSLPDTLDADALTAVDTKAAKMFGSMCSYSIDVATWRDPAGDLWEPGATIMLEAPSAMVATSYEFVIRTVTFKVTGDKRTATLNLVLPGAFSGTAPESLPWAS